MSIVFTDSFTVAENILLTSYPSGSPDYGDCLRGSLLSVNASTDRVQSGESGNMIARIIDATVPTGDQKITCNVGWTTGYNAGYAGCRGSVNNCYIITRATSSTWELYRVDSGAFTLLTSYSITTSDNSSASISLEATGTTTVSLIPTIAGTVFTAYNDSSANRKTSGTPVIGMYRSGGTQWIDNVSVDDLAAGTIVTVNQVTETNLAQTIGKAKNKALSQITETDLSQAISVLKSRQIGQVTESNLSQAVGKLKAKQVAQVFETDLAQAINSAGAKIITINQVNETSVSNGISKLKTRQVGQVFEIDLAQSIFKNKARSLSQVNETDLAQIITWAPKNRLVNRVQEIDTAQVVVVFGVGSAASGLSRILLIGVSGSGVTTTESVTGDN